MKKSVEQTPREGQDSNDTCKDEEMACRDIAGLAVVCWSAINRCVDILRVHDVQTTALACSVMEKILGQTPEVEPEVCFYSLFPNAKSHQKHQN